MRSRKSRLLATIVSGAAALAVALAYAETAAAFSRPARESPVTVAQSSAPSTMPAPVGPEPQSTTATYGDWVLRCVLEAAAGSPRRMCEVGQTIEVKGQGVVAQIALGFPSGKEPMRVTVVLPPNVSLSSAVRIGVSETDEGLELAWKRCLPGGCVAEGEIHDDVLRSWRAQTGAGQIRYALASSKPLSLAFSFRGFSVALDNLAKSAAAP